MKRLLLILIVSFAVHAAFATSLDTPPGYQAVLLNAFFTPSGGEVNFFLNSGNEAQPTYLSFTGIDVVSLTCGNAACTKFNSDIVLSGFIGGDVLGSLHFTSNRLSVAVNGLLTFCATPQIVHHRCTPWMFIRTAFL